MFKFLLYFLSTNYLLNYLNWHRFRHTCATARLSAGWQLIRVSCMLGHKTINTTASHYAEYDLSACPAGFEGMVKVYAEFVEWLDSGYFSTFQK
ncbi:MAG: tyrosine-type recombinase/integrase [Fibromonadaceae bacterium]|nr:tyrosine-type recombinase/integrase [Fibromonadaceae bacterium]